MVFRQRPAAWAMKPMPGRCLLLFFGPSFFHPEPGNSHLIFSAKGHEKSTSNEALPEKSRP